MTMFIRAVAAEDKATVIKQAVAGKRDDTFFPNLANFKELPGTPFAYWVGEGIRGVFKRFPSVEGDGRAVRQGLATANDFRFLRAQWEIDPGKRGAKWFPFAKGGELSPFYASLHLVIHWDEAGKELKAWADPLYNNSGWSRIIKSTELYFKPGMTWPLRASRFAPQPLPAGCIFSVRGYSVFLPETSLLPGLSLFNSKPFDYLFKALLGRFGYPEFIVGVLQKLPWAEPSAEQAKALAVLARTAWSAARTADTGVETSLAFTLPRPINVRARAAAESVLAELQSRIDVIAFDVFGLDESDRTEIEGASVFVSAEIAENTDEDDEVDEIGATNEHFCLQSWSVGVAFGRFDIRLATGERSIPPEPEPFYPLPAKSPGMLPDGDAPFMPCSGVLVDDQGHSDDLVTRVNAVYERVGEPPPDPEVLRQSLARDFFPHTLRCTRRAGARRRSTGNSRRLQRATQSGSTSMHSPRTRFSAFRTNYVAPEAHTRGAAAGVNAHGSSVTSRQRCRAQGARRARGLRRGAARSA